MSKGVEVSRTKEEELFLEGDILRCDILKVLFSQTKPVRREWLSEQLPNIKETSLVSALCIVAHLECADLQVTKVLVNGKYINEYLLVKINGPVICAKKKESSIHRPNEPLLRSNNQIFEQAKNQTHFALLNQAL